ncbi:hypothetical protein ANANG_G00131950 [Anguilla anguilla]|uniref:RRM domain-containing protein n=1 Tax=Anguilla anguilla TaxID=7936 RepID=A0A9D3MKR0_ANGAN|nr:hypothetical protein ANANG_G00131950 [Anguilla anguilla]
MDGRLETELYPLGSRYVAEIDSVHDITVGTKRGSDELFTSCLSNGSYIMSANGNDSKKFKGDIRSPSIPSRVVHVRKLPNDINEAEVISLGLPFGKVTNLLMLKGKNQAFLEMSTEETAQTMVTYYSSVPPVIRNHPIFMQYSNHKELKTDNSPNQVRAQAALQAVNAVQTGGMSVGGMPGVGVAGMEASGMGGQSPVLRVIVENLFYPVTLDVLHQIFSKFGTVLKIITFTKNNQFQALLQYADSLTAQHSKLSLDGQNIYNACCTLRISFSKLTSLNVKYNNDKSRDYTRPDLPTGDSQPPLEHQAMAAFALSLCPWIICALCPEVPWCPACLLTVSCAVSCRCPWDNLCLHTGKLSGDPAISVAIQQAGLTMPGVPGALASLGMPSAAAAAHAAASRLGLSGLSGLSAAHCVLLVSNLNPESVTPNCLFTLFGVYGDVMRVKILFNKKDNALVQMADGTQAQLAMSHLKMCSHTTVQLPREGHEDQGLTKDYSSSPLHRFKKPGSKNYQNIFPPSATLHLSNIPPSVVEDDLKSLFASSGALVKAFKFFQKDRKMALIQMSSVEEAIESLIEFHNHDLGENHHLRVSFSKSTI